MSFLDQIGEELEEESDQQQADVHTVHIGIGRYNHFIITQSLYAVFYVQCGLQQIEFFVFVNHFLGQAERIEWFTTEAEYSLCVYIPAFGDGTACRVTFGDEDARFLFQPFAFHIVQVDTAITQFPVVQIGFLSTFTCQFRNSGNSLAFFFRILYLL